ncbi:MAG: hypothetical protein ACI9R3_004378 [Verrucomicrobiales bacterium]|jgi:hypothetical protein
MHCDRSPIRATADSRRDSATGTRYALKWYIMNAAKVTQNPPGAALLIERLLGVLMAEHLQTLSSIKAQLAEVRDERLEPYRETLIRAKKLQVRHISDLDGDRLLAPEHEEDLPEEAKEAIETSTEVSANMTTDVLEDVVTEAAHAPRPGKPGC